MSVIIHHSYKNRTIEYLDILPQTSIQIKSLFGLELKNLIYLFDYKNQRIIKQNAKTDKHPYRYLRAKILHIPLKDDPVFECEQKILIPELTKSYQNEN